MKKYLNQLQFKANCKYTKIVFSLLIAICFSAVVHAVPSGKASDQPKNVSGQVTGADGISLPGVNVLIKGTNKGVVTNNDGNYSLEVENPNTILVFSFIGFITQEVTVNSQTTINVILKEDVKSLDEVIVTGYGTQKKKDLTGSISRVSGDELIQPSTLSFDQMLQGKVAGVQISQTSGAPGGNVNSNSRYQFNYWRKPTIVCC